MRHIPLSSLSVSTISAACTCYDNRNGHHLINTLLMTAFEKKLAIYSFSMEDLRISSTYVIENRKCPSFEYYENKFEQKYE